jgi:hypothetical protein
MSDEQFSIFLEWLMCSDPWPLRHGHEEMVALGNAEARRRGYEGWVQAYHQLPSAANDP